MVGPLRTRSEGRFLCGTDTGLRSEEELSARAGRLPGREHQLCQRGQAAGSSPVWKGRPRPGHEGSGNFCPEQDTTKKCIFILKYSGG